MMPRAALLLMVFFSQAAAADDVATFRFRKELTLPALEKEELVVFPIDVDVYAESQPNFADLRILDENGNVVPYIVRKDVELRSRPTRVTWKVNDVALKRIDDRGLEIRFSLKDDKPNRDPSPTGMRLVTPLTNFEQRVQVYGINDQGAEEPLGKEAVLFDYTENMDVRNDEISLPENNYRKFRIVVQEITSDQESQLMELTRSLRTGTEEERQEKVMIRRRPFRIDRIELFTNSLGHKESGAFTRSYPIEKFTAVVDDLRKFTVITVETHREPLVEFELKTPNRHFDRRVRVQGIDTGGQTGGEKEEALATTRISRLDFGDIRKNELRLPFAEQRFRTYRILIDNRDSPPLEYTGVEAKGHAYHVAFFATRGQKLALYYGSDDAKAPDYDVAAIKAAIANDSGKRAELGEPVTVSDGTQPLRPSRFFSNKVVFGALLIGLVLLLGWSLYHASRRIEQIPDDE
ncbi:MAG: hypothetical protein AB7O26_15860 [Planctomycetaceae bacterium]